MKDSIVTSIPSFEPITSLPTWDETSEFIRISQLYPSLQKQYWIPFSRHLEQSEAALILRAGPALNGTYGNVISLIISLIKIKKTEKKAKWGKKELDGVYHDYNCARREVYQRDSIAFYEKRERFTKDSLSKRINFVRDSIQKRTTFVRDSIQKRTTFVEDSIYRANYRINNNYDYVEWSGSHGEPLMCYRNGIIVYGIERDEKGLITKEWKDGVCIHNYSYEVDSFYNKYTRYDSVDNKRDHYNDKTFETVKATEWLDREGKTIKETYSSGRKRLYTWYPDGEKQTETYMDENGKMMYSYKCSRLSGGQVEVVEIQYAEFLFDGYDSFFDGPLPFKRVTEYYSDGKRSQRWKYNRYNGKWTLREHISYRGSYTVTKYYDMNGKYERTTTSW